MPRSSGPSLASPSAQNKSQQVKQSRAVGVAFAGQSMNMQAPSRSSFGPWAGWGGRFVFHFFLSRISDGQKMFLLGVGGKMNPFRRIFDKTIQTSQIPGLVKF